MKQLRENFKDEEAALACKLELEIKYHSSDVTRQIQKDLGVQAVFVCEILKQVRLAKKITSTSMPARADNGPGAAAITDWE